eukprot:CAMPEP_0170903580 /NCGR_PEP_ID=MMETSP0734-20130129/49861_1 /TAXON_ID=186038 /ORGANISM="Fragilariopsis kerguelensis, Strain L26-C5" /LENGTH=312 /DNA_ID=CAMNT_0011298813 /DNA_START=120 /DNA_END=1054 /DNA_ORIENTATION=-
MPIISSKEHQQQHATHEQHEKHEQHIHHTKKEPGWQKAFISNEVVEGRLEEDGVNKLTMNKKPTNDDNNNSEKKDSKSKSTKSESKSKSKSTKKSKSNKFKSTTDAPTNTPTNTPTTNAPTDKPTNAPTDAPTNAPIDASTNGPTDVPTDAPTNAPTNAPSKFCEKGSIRIVENIDPTDPDGSGDIILSLGFNPLTQALTLVGSNFVTNGSVFRTQDIQVVDGELVAPIPFDKQIGDSSSTCTITKGTFQPEQGIVFIKSATCNYATCFPTERNVVGEEENCFFGLSGGTLDIDAATLIFGKTIKGILQGGT